jgi:two-component system, NtrC family, response regulator HydG
VNYPNVVMGSDDDGNVPSPTEGGATLQRSRSAPPPGMRPAYALLVASGPDKGKRFFFDDELPPRVLLGTSPVCHFRLSDREVSRRHAAFEIDDIGLRMTDLGSTNGVRIGGIRIREVWLAGGQILQVGSTHLKVLDIPVTEAPRGEVVTHLGRMLGESTVMQRLYPTCERAAASMEPLLVEGETGTGKELLAECMHEQGPRAQGPFVVLDCTTLAPHDVDATLFGSTADSRTGVFEQADGGTLVLDEVGELDAATQSKLLRAIERREIRPVGASEVKRVDVRVISTSRHDMDRLVQEGKLRDDLFFRLSVLRIELPPLRARIGDVPLLASHFWRTLGGEGDLPPDLAARLQATGDWPGNVRELMNLVARRLALGELRVGPRFRDEGVVDSIDRVLELELAFPQARERVVMEFERRYIERVLATHGGNVSRAAAASGVARRYFQIVKARQRAPGT